MGKRKRISAEKRKEIKKATTIASLRNSTMSPRKMRLVADLVRGKKVEEALNILSFSTKHAARSLKKLLLSAISNWEQKNTDSQNTISDLYIKTIYVEQGRTLKRILPAPQGRAYRVRKRSNHVTLILDTKKINQKAEQTQN